MRTVTIAQRRYTLAPIPLDAWRDVPELNLHREHVEARIGSMAAQYRGNVVAFAVENLRGNRVVDPADWKHFDQAEALGRAMRTMAVLSLRAGNPDLSEPDAVALVDRLPFAELGPLVSDVANLTEATCTEAIHNLRKANAYTAAIATAFRD